MFGASETLLSLIIIALGILGVILSYLVPDRKKSLIALVLGLIIIVVGAFQYAVHSRNNRRFHRQFQNISRDRNVDMEKLREDFQKRAKDAREQTTSPSNR